MMRKIFALVLSILSISSCSSDDAADIDCALFDPAFPSLFIKIVDETGTNLIENGTIDPNTLSAEGDFTGSGFRFIPPDEFATPDTDIRAFDNTLSLFIPNESTFQYTINWGNMQSFNVDFRAEIVRIPCGISYFIPVEANSDTEELEITENSLLSYLVVIEL